LRVRVRGNLKILNSLLVFYGLCDLFMVLSVLVWWCFVGFRVRVCVSEVRGRCALGYRPGECFTVEGFYISEVGRGVCIHALASMLTLLAPFLKGVSARTLGIGRVDDVGYVQCPDPGEPYTCGGTVVFELRRRVGEGAGQ
jgi:uncharacterized repeat protein (TIGR04076 family)